MSASDLVYKERKTRADIECLLEEHKRLVYAMLTRTGQLTNQDAESAAWEALWDAIGTYSPYERVQFSTYACTCIKNAIYSVCRKQLNEQRRFNEYLESTESEQQSIYMDEYNFESKPVMDAVDRAMAIHMKHPGSKHKSILQAWYASNFTATPSALAKFCGTAPSVASRVLIAFRATLANELRGLE